MPTTRTRRSRARQDPGLRVEMQDMLLLGKSRPDAEIAELRRQGIPYDVFCEFDYGLNSPVLAQLWQEHRDMLMQEWQKRGGKGKPWGCKFDQGPG
jgi:hypothetical protein